ncbi:MAG: hypothetical protein RI973_606 [Bacteroidota bacterium]|jgi:hypothetical protein
MGLVRLGFSIKAALMVWTGPSRMTKGGIFRRGARITATKREGKDWFQH